MGKLRTDSWAAGLSEEQSWALYSKARRCQWQEAAERRENAARNALGDTKLTDAAKIAKMKEIFG